MEKPLDAYPRHPGIKSGRSAVCKSCKVEKNQIYNYTITTKDGLDIATNCQLCKIDLTDIKVCIDHDHTSGLVRGIICNKCNIGIALLGDNLEGLEKAVSYLSNPPMLSRNIKYRG
jgi:hypothetical protein